MKFSILCLFIAALGAGNLSAEEKIRSSREQKAKLGLFNQLIGQLATEVLAMKSPKGDGDAPIITEFDSRFDTDQTVPDEDQIGFNGRFAVQHVPWVPDKATERPTDLYTRYDHRAAEVVNGLPLYVSDLDVDLRTDTAALFYRALTGNFSAICDGKAPAKDGNKLETEFMAEFCPLYHKAVTKNTTGAYATFLKEAFALRVKLQKKYPGVDGELTESIAKSFNEGLQDSLRLDDNKEVVGLSFKKKDIYRADGYEITRLEIDLTAESLKIGVSVKLNALYKEFDPIRKRAKELLAVNDKLGVNPLTADEPTREELRKVLTDVLNDTWALFDPGVVQVVK